MPRLTGEQWTQIRAEREAGESFRDLAAKHGITHQAIVKRASKEGWSGGEDVAEVVRRKVAEKVAGIVAAESPQKRAEAMDAEAAKVAAVVQRHRQEWVQVAKLRQEALEVRAENPDLAFNRAKLAKITSEMTAIQQAGERKAWGLDAEAAKADVVVRWEGNE